MTDPLRAALETRSHIADGHSCNDTRGDTGGRPNDWLNRLAKAEQENHCGDAACMTRRVSAAIRVLTGGKEHQDYCWAVESFEAELGVRDPALIGMEPSNAMLDTARPGLEEAWAEAEAALPEGWERVSLTTYRHFPTDSRWVAGFADDWPRLERPIRTYGATPVDALRALAARLTEDRP